MLVKKSDNSAKTEANKQKKTLEALKNTFEEGDADKDGYHSISEIQDVLIDQAKAALINGFHGADKNRDGVVTEEEYINATNRTKEEFRETDENLDGKHTLDEQLNHFAGTKLFLEEMDKTLQTAKEILRHDDKDGDGRLSEEEFLAHSKTLLRDVHNEASFRLADTNKDGVHDTDEIVAEIMRVAGFAKKGGHFIEHGVEEAFKAADTNGDGVVTKQEYLQTWNNATAADFDRSDENKDGRTTLEEASAHQSVHLVDTLKLAEEEAQKHIAAADQNGDGKLNLAEKNHAVHLANSDKMFQASDTNKDGFHDRAEVRSEMIRQAGYTAVVDGRKGKGDEEFQYFLPDAFIAGFRHADADADEVVTEEEFLKAYKDHEPTAADFKEHDTDGDGVHSLTEMAIKIRNSKEWKKVHENAEVKASQLIKDADKDGDGKISAREFADHLLSMTNETDIKEL
jgi:Ca2+-binding EF-hand superfamily protein